MSAEYANPSPPHPPQAAPSSLPAVAGGDARPPYAVLYVDDEEQALKYFKKAFGKSFDVLTAVSVDEALGVLATRHADIGIVLTDHRMPGRTGVELLAAVKASWPATVRIMVTAYADVESAVGAVNSGAVYKYLTKPMDLPLTKRVLTEAMAGFVEAKDCAAVVADKGELFERAIVADRVRNAARMASGVSHHVRNSLTAVNCFFEEMRDRVTAAGAGRTGAAAAAAADDEYLDQLLVLADQERVRLVGMISDVEARGVRRSFKFDAPLDLAEVVARAAAAASSAPRAAGRPLNVSAEVPPGTASVAVDVAAVVQMLGTLIVYAERYSPAGSALRVVADGLMPMYGAPAVLDPAAVRRPVLPGVGRAFAPAAQVA
jgi:CheY-like chemotaxis protein